MNSVLELDLNIGFMCLCLCQSAVLDSYLPRNIKADV